MQKIVACIDGAGYTQGVCDYAAWAATRLNAPLEFLHVLIREAEVALDASGSIGLGAQEALLDELAELDQRRSLLAREHGRQLLEGARDRALEAGLGDVDIRQRHGELLDALMEVQTDTRLYVMGQHDHEVKPKRFLLDHNLESAVRALHRPILVSVPQYSIPLSFMIAFDGSATAHKMVDMVADSALLRGLDCVVATVGDDIEALQWARQRLVSAGFQTTTVTLQGEPADALLNHMKQAGIDMLVMGAYGHSRIRQLVVGSTTTSILRRATSPVFILR